jgi:hypothetical protein
MRIRHPFTIIQAAIVGLLVGCLSLTIFYNVQTGIVALGCLLILTGILRASLGDRLRWVCRNRWLDAIMSIVLGGGIICFSLWVVY